MEQQLHNRFQSYLFYINGIFLLKEPLLLYQEWHYQQVFL